LWGLLSSRWGVEMAEDSVKNIVGKKRTLGRGVVPLGGAEVATEKENIGQKSALERRTPPRGATIAADGTLRCRFECKYQISEAKAAAVEKFIQPYLHPDRYCKLQPTGSYPIVSLYLDSPNLQLCKESLTGQKNRFKLRIRGYNDDPSYPKFFEIKRRLNFTIVKDRHRVKHSEVERLLSGGPLPEQYYSTEQEPLKQFLFYMRAINAGPIVLVRYIRRAYEDDSENRVRITFDRKLSFKMCDQPRVTLNSPGWQRYPISDVILEIKFTSRFPTWLTHLARCLELQQQSFSKYASSVCGASAMRFSAPRVYGFNGT
jgi:hypothetical protein